MELFNVCNSGDTQRALSLIKICVELQVRPNKIAIICDITSDVNILICSIDRNLYDVSTQLIKNKMYNSNHATKKNNTTLTVICKKQTYGQSKFIWNDIAFTLINEMSDEILELSNVDKLSALAYACRNNLNDIVMKIIERNKKCLTNVTKESRDEIVSYAKRNDVFADMIFKGYQNFLSIKCIDDKYLCMICNEFTDSNYIFEKCCHVSHCCDTCISPLLTCPFCRTESNNKKVFIMNS